MSNPGSQPILVTGTSSGIGLDIATTLAGKGHPVFATARKDEDLEMLAGIPNVIPVRMDVRRPEQVMAAVEQVQRAGLGLYGLVNNAGVGGLGLIPTWTDEEVLDIFDVNVFGPFRVTNACLPQLLRARGRVVLISSQGGMISKKYYGPYTMTKHALEAYSVALRAEVEEHGVRVSIIQPGGVITRAGDNALAGMIARLKRAEPPFKAEADLILASFDRSVDDQADAEEEESDANRKPSPPGIVTQAVEDALFSENPKFRYLVGTEWEGNRVLNALIEKLLDENDNPAHGYSRDRLIQMLDEQISARKSMSG